MSQHGLEDSLADAMKCAERARDLARDLDRVRGPADLRQVAAGVRQEIDCIIRRVSDAQDERRQLATGYREGKMRVDASATSKAAARAVTVKTGSQRALVLLELYRGGDLTDFELQTRLKLAASSERPRRGELVDAGFVQAVLHQDGSFQGMGRTKTHNGSEWQLWTLTASGLAVARKLANQAPGNETFEEQAQSLF
jgi:hypothetical protein